MFFRFVIVGLINTIFSLIIFTIVFYKIGLSIFISNLLSYFFGILLSYALNSVVTFQSKFSWFTFFKYVVVVGLCYCLNLIVLYAFHHVLNTSAWFSQIISMGVYTMSFYNLSRFVIWKAQGYEKL
jgi:putative flippase GtrA